MNLIKILLLLFISLNTSFKVISGNHLHGILKQSGKLIFIRHAYAPGGGDPEGFELSKGESKRNLNIQGIEQSKRIG